MYTPDIIDNTDDSAIAHIENIDNNTSTNFNISPAFDSNIASSPTDKLILSDLPNSFPISRQLSRSESRNESRKTLPLALAASHENLHFEPDFDVCTSFDIQKPNWRQRSDTCSLSSRNSEDEDDEDRLYGTSALSNTSFPLTPFKNQVGGHASFLRFSAKALCKPIDLREQAFYEHIASAFPQLMPFVASYLGVVNVTFKALGDSTETSDAPVIMLEHNKHLLGNLDDLSKSEILSTPEKYVNWKLQRQVFKEALSPKGLRARFAQLQSVSDVLDGSWKAMVSPHDSSESIIPNITASSDFEPKPKMFASNVVDNSKNPAITIDYVDDHEPIFRMSDDESHNLRDSLTLEDSGDCSDRGLKPIKFHKRNIPVQKHFNPWSAHLYNTRLAKMRNAPPAIQQFLLLEDLTEGLIFPCILDLKMGTRQHGVNATAEKKASQERKCDRSTSMRLGVRICGMQVINYNKLYKQTTRAYKYLDKYVGRQINPANFKQAILSFIDCGTHYLIGHIPVILEKLRLLYDVISTMPTSRFYASSLLIFYDGSFESEKQADIKAIDFANCVMTLDKDCNYPPTTLGPDGGYLRGLRTLIANFEEIYRELCDGGGGHVLIQSLSLSQRAAVQIGQI